MRSGMIRFAVAVVAFAGIAGENQAAFVVYTDQASFQAAAPGLTSQTFAMANVANGGGVGFTGPLDSSTNNGIFAPGDIAPGLTINAANSQLAALGIGFSGNTEKSVFSDNGVGLNLTFAPSINAIGLTLFSEFSIEQFTVTIFNEDEILIDTLTTPNVATTGVGTFYGLIGNAGERIGRVNLLSPAFEGVTGVQFGDAGGSVATPLPPTLLAGFLGMGLLAGVRRFRRA